MEHKYLFHGPGFITNDAWLANHLGCPQGPLYHPSKHALQVVADADAGMQSRNIARKYGYASADSARSAVRKFRLRLKANAVEF